MANCSRLGQIAAVPNGFTSTMPDGVVATMIKTGTGTAGSFFINSGNDQCVFSINHFGALKENNHDYVAINVPLDANPSNGHGYNLTFSSPINEFYVFVSALDAGRITFPSNVNLELISGNAEIVVDNTTKMIKDLIPPDRAGINCSEVQTLSSSGVVRVTGTNMTSMFLGFPNQAVAQELIAFNFGSILCSIDSDSDGMANNFESDSDGDGCFDAFESGATTNISLATITGPYGANGLANSKETNDTPTAAINYTSTYSTNALNKNILSCCIVEAGNDVTLCSGSDATLMGTYTGSFVWSADPGNPAVVSITSPSAASTSTGAFTTAGTYKFLLRSSLAGCRDSVYITVLPNSTSECLDNDTDGVPNGIDIDDDNDGILDVVECNNDPSNCQDKDSDGIINSFDLDSDNDGCMDAQEAGLTTDVAYLFKYTGAVGTNGYVNTIETAVDNGVPVTAPNYGPVINKGQSACCSAVSAGSNQNVCMNDTFVFMPSVLPGPILWSYSQYYSASFTYANLINSNTANASVYDFSIADRPFGYELNNRGCISIITLNTFVAPNKAEITPSGSVTACGTSGVILSDPNGSFESYQWYKDGVAISGATSRNYTATTSGSYTVSHFAESCDSPLSDPTIVTVSPQAELTVSNNSIIVPVGTTMLKIGATSDEPLVWSPGGETTDSITVTLLPGFNTFTVTSGTSPCIVSQVINIQTPVDTDNDGIFNTEDLDDDNDGLLDFYEDLACSSPSANSNSGNGNFKSNIRWVNWGSALDDGIQNGDVHTETLADGTVINVTFANASGTGLAALRPSDMSSGYAGATLHQLYNTSGNRDALSSNRVTSTVFKFELRITATKSGEVVPLNIILADAEATTPLDEKIEITTNGKPWQQLESNGTSTVTGIGTTTATYTNTDAGNKILFTSDANVVSINSKTTAIENTIQGIAVGFIVPCDKDGDCIRNSLEIDSDNDGCLDINEAGHNKGAGATSLTGPYGANGVANSVETSPESGTINYTVAKAGSTPLFVSTTPLISGANMGCGGVNYNMTAATTGGTWSVVSTIGSTISASGVYSPAANSTGSNAVDTIKYNGVACGASFVFTVKAKPTITVTNSSPICIGTNLTFASSGGNTYKWAGPNSFASTTQNPTIASASLAAAGNYTITVTGANSCTSTAMTTVVVNPNPTPTATNSGPVCIGAPINLMSSGGNTYAWSGPNAFSSAMQNPMIATTVSATSGAYIVTVTSAAGCTATATTTVILNASPIVTSTPTNPTCNGGSNGQYAVNITSGTGPYSFSDGTNMGTGKPASFSVTNLSAGTYVVTITDANNCTATSSVTITNPAAGTAIATVTQPVCAGNTGSVALSTTVLVSPVTYAYSGTTSGSGSGTSISNLSAGSYTITVTGSLGCTATTSAVVTAPAALLATATATNPICNGSSNGSIALSVSSGTISSYTYNAGSGNVNGTGSTIAGLTSGTYNITVTNNIGCTAVVSSPTVLINPSALSITSSKTDVSSFGGSDGSYTLTMINGTSPFSYSDNRGNSGSALTSPITKIGLTGQTYNITVTDANGCTATTSVTISSPLCNAMITLMPTSPQCNGGTNGSIAINATGVTTPISYTYSGAASGSGSGATIPVLTAGNYAVNIVDALGCTASRATTIVAPAAILLSITATNVDCNGASTGSLTLSSSGSAAISTYTYTGTTSGSGIGNNIGSLAAGTYNVTITDANGCTASKTNITITQPAALSSAAGTDATVCGLTTALNATAPALGTGAWTQTSGPGTSTFTSTTSASSSVTVTMQGVYTYTWTVSSGACTPATDQVVITYQAMPMANAGADQSMICGLSATLAATSPTIGTGMWTVINGPAPLTITPNTSATASVTGTVAGSYTLRWTVTNGTCPPATDDVVIVLSTCDADNDGVLNNVDTDDDNDGILDTAEFAGDSDGDGIADKEDRDADNDGITDAQEAYQKSTTYGDAANDGFLNTISGPNIGVNSDGSLMITYPTTLLDSDGDGIPNHRDLDSDGDGLPDTFEGNFQVVDGDNDGHVGVGLPADADKDGIANQNDPDFAGNVITGFGFNQDRDGDGVKNYLDIDIDNDGIVDNIEGQPTYGYIAPSGGDSNNNGLRDIYEPALGGVAVGYTNTDGGSAPDYADANSDIEGAGTDPFDIEENFYTPTGTEEGFGSNGILLATNFVDADEDGLADVFDLISGFTTANNANNNQSPISQPGAAGSDRNWRTAGDNDKDGIIDINDQDDDNDGISDTVEGNTDSDGDGSTDDHDLDSDGDGIPDVKEAGGSDPDGDGILGTTTIGTATVVDANGNPSGGPLTPTDIDGDGIANYKDRDSDNDGITDAQESGGGDSNGDGILGVGITNDSDGDGLADVVDPIDNRPVTFAAASGLPIAILNSDGMGMPDYLDLDSDNDGIADVKEAGGADPDNNGIIGMGASATISDIDMDGLADMVDIRNNLTNSAGTGIKLLIPNTDANTGADYIDLDSDNDGIVDNIEAQTTAGYIAPSGMDTDGDGVDNLYDGSPLWGMTSGIIPENTDGIDLPDYRDTDSDNDEKLDRVEAGFGNPSGTDTDHDGIDNAYDVVSGIGPVSNITNNQSPMTLLNTDLPNTQQRDYREEGKDTDNDGVQDDDDSCPNTPPADITFVELNGCVDKDGDGFYSDTLAGASFDPDDANGCIPDTLSPTCTLVDADGDGYYPNISPSNSKYDPDDTKPCIPDNTVLACDGDGDGVADGLDSCPNSPAGARLRAGFNSVVGCLDVDGDGYYPDITPASTSYDPDDMMPCVPSMAVAVCDTDQDGISDATDACPFTLLADVSVVNTFGCTDRDGDGYFPDRPTTAANFDPKDNNPCIPEPSEVLYVGVDADGDGYFENYPTTHVKFDPDDTKVCIPDNTFAGCDADGDGVADGLDQCSNTPSGAAVDAAGCSDVDGDGFRPYDLVTAPNRDPNDADPCIPNINSAKCDTDNDGVPNGMDQCPTSVLGATVNAQGCTDFDGDGYFEDAPVGPAKDLNDQNPCIPNTASPLCDTDNDGVPNSADICPNSLPGSNILIGFDPLKGCLDRDGDKFYDDGVGMSKDIDDSQPCIPSATAATCNLIDADGDGFFSNVSSTAPQYDPNDNTACIPNAASLLCDTDNDGVADAQDQCPFTALGADINITGCTDGDKDGFYPDTNPTSSTYDPNDANVCLPIAVDTDGDGFCDKQEELIMSTDKNNACSPNNNAATCDTDHDGITDGRDQCPLTAAGASPNAQGCTDADGDGFYPDAIITSVLFDSNDNNACMPSTTNSACVPQDADGDGFAKNYAITHPLYDPNDTKACIPNDQVTQCDDDHDGIKNALDLCPFSQPGFLVNNQGCADADNDGFYPDASPSAVNYDPNDSNGCFPKMSNTACLDNDGDGIENSLDLCPYTPSGVIANTEGCGDADRDGSAENVDPDEKNVCIPNNEGPTCDSDGDGIINSADLCNGTAAGLTVNSSGCPDADGDGVFLPTDTNDNNKCIPNSNGPACDSDGDGIANNIDLCANTPAGNSVNSQGCRDRDGDGIFENADPNDTNPCIPSTTSATCTDSDNDGVANTIDLCPNTPAGSIINASGCRDRDGDSIAENTDTNDNNPCVPVTTGAMCDSDGDGVLNSADLCNGTAAGLTVDAIGCPDADGDGVFLPTDTDDSNKCIPNSIGPTCDSDGDGIANNVDQCASTPAGSSVNSQGCRDHDGDGIFENADPNDTNPCIPSTTSTTCTDSDNDGVANTSDLCPNTPAGSIVNASGCRDRDADSIAENTDTNDNNPCVPVTTGAMCDSDGDGVINSADNCNGTPAGLSVNASGCPDADGVFLPTDTNDNNKCIPNSNGPTCDSDGDGIANNIDLCANTPAGSSVNSQGCRDRDGDGEFENNDPNDTNPCLPNSSSTTCTDVDVDGVLNAADLCPNTPYGAIVNIMGCRDADGDSEGENTDPNDNNKCIPNNTGPMCDTDGDGVMNSADLCANTPSGTSVNAQGCPDADGDGVFANTDPNDNNKCIPNNTGATCDTDGDGIANSFDLCPGTPSGATVNGQGCRDIDADGVIENNDPNDTNPCIPNTSNSQCLDFDNDGVPNTSDLCPGTPSGAAVNAMGCRDADGDGVAENTDPNDNNKCIPNNTGPTCDTDGDGVMNSADQCANTPSGAAVNAEGCKDSDGDGFSPEQTGPKFDPNDGNGCIPSATSPTCIDSDGDGVPNISDQCPTTPTGSVVNAQGCKDTDGDGFGDEYPSTSPLFDADDNDGCIPNPNAIVCDPGTPDSDLTPTWTFGNTTYAVGDERFVVVNINEASGNNHIGGIEFFVPNSAGFQYTFDGSLSNATVINSIAVDNNQWTMTTNAQGILFTYTGGTLPGNGRSRVAIKVKALVLGAKANITANINPTVGNDSQPYNNIAVLSQSIQN